MFIYTYTSKPILCSQTHMLTQQRDGICSRTIPDACFLWLSQSTRFCVFGHVLPPIFLPSLAPAPRPFTHQKRTTHTGTPLVSEHSTLPYNVLPACSAWKVDSTNGDLYYWRAAFNAVDADADGSVAISDIGVCVRARARAWVCTSTVWGGGL